MIVSPHFILIIMSWPLSGGSASGVPPYTINRHQPALHKTSMVNSPSNIPKFASWLPDKEFVHTRCDVHRWSPNSSPISLDHALQVYIQTCSIMASKCISKHAPSWSPNVSPDSLDYGLLVPTIMVSKFISKLCWSRPPSAHQHCLDVPVSKLPQTYGSSVSPMVLDYGLQVYLQAHLISTIMFTTSWVLRTSPNSLAHDIRVHFFVHLMFIFWRTVNCSHRPLAACPDIPCVDG